MSALTILGVPLANRCGLFEDEVAGDCGGDLSLPVNSLRYKVFVIIDREGKTDLSFFRSHFNMSRGWSVIASEGFDDLDGGQGDLYTGQSILETKQHSLK